MSDFERIGPSATAILRPMSNRMKIALAAVAAAAAVIVTAVGLAVVADDPPSKTDYQTSVASARNRTDAALLWVTKSQSSEELIARLETPRSSSTGPPTISPTPARPPVTKRRTRN